MRRERDLGSYFAILRCQLAAVVSYGLRGQTGVTERVEYGAAVDNRAAGDRYEPEPDY